VAKLECSASWRCRSYSLNSLPTLIGNLSQSNNICAQGSVSAVRDSPHLARRTNWLDLLVQAKEFIIHLEEPSLVRLARFGHSDYRPPLMSPSTAKTPDPFDILVVATGSENRSRRGHLQLLSRHCFWTTIRPMRRERSPEHCLAPDSRLNQIWLN
jgi:hypothetical protein